MNLHLFSSFPAWFRFQCSRSRCLSWDQGRRRSRRRRRRRMGRQKTCCTCYILQYLIAYNQILTVFHSYVVRGSELKYLWLFVFILFNAVMSSDTVTGAEQEYILGHPAELHYCFWISGIWLHQCRVSSLYAGWRGHGYPSESWRGVRSKERRVFREEGDRGKYCNSYHKFIYTVHV